MVNLSKSKYCNLWQCPKMAWLNIYKPELRTVDESLTERMETGNVVGDLAMGLFGDYIDVTYYIGGRINLSVMLSRTKEEMEKGTQNICEASFVYNGLFCSVDILRKTDAGWAIYEVKSSSHHEDSAEAKDVYLADIAYQKYVLTHLGMNITGTYLIQINGDYIFDGTLDLEQFFAITDVAAEICNQYADIEKNLAIAERVLESEDEPEYDLDLRCFAPYKCQFWEYCSQHVPSPSVFDLYRLPKKKMMEYYHNGIVTYDDLILQPNMTNPTRIRQMEYYLQDKGTYVDKGNIAEFLQKLSYPLYFLDFETMQPAIPQFVGTKPYAQIPFQYSLHYIEREGGELKHKEFLAVSGEDPRRSIAEALVRDIPMNVCVTAYNKAFECTRLKELAAEFPDLAEHLLNIRDNIVDLLEPFQKGYYYNREMGGSFSIKSVLPAIFPDDPELNYHNLEGVHNGSEAMSIFPKIKDMEPSEREQARYNLLKYCELDTYAMVKVWEELVRVTQ